MIFFPTGSRPCGDATFALRLSSHHGVGSAAIFDFQLVVTGVPRAPGGIKSDAPLPEFLTDTSLDEPPVGSPPENFEENDSMPKERPKPQRVWCTTSRPHGDDVGAIAEGATIWSKRACSNCAPLTAPYRGGADDSRQLQPNDDPRRVAMILLRARELKRGSDFNRKLQYRPLGIV
jgi:hypothetical protein